MIMEKMKGVVMLVVLVIITGALLPVLITTVDESGATGVEATMLDYLPLFVILGVALALILYAVGWLGKGD